MKRTILKAVGYGVFFLFAVLFFMYWTFPMDKVRHWVEQAALEKLKLDLSIGDMELSGLNGFEATDVVLRFRSKKPAKAEPGGIPEDKKTDGRRPDDGPAPTATAGPGLAGAEPGAGTKGPGPGAASAKAGGAAGAAVESPAEAGEAEEVTAKPVWRTIRIDRLEVHVGLYDVLFGDTLELTADVEALGGRVEGLHVVSEKGGKRWKISAEKLDGLKLAELPLEEWLGTNLKGRLSGSLTVELGKDIHASRAVAELEITKAQLPTPALEQTVYGETQTFVLSDVALGTVKVSVTLDRKGNIPALGAKSGDKSTVIFLERLEAAGGDLDLGLEERSTITINKGQKLADAYLNVMGSFRIEPAFFDRQVERNGDKEKPNLFLRTLLQGDRKWRTAEREGVYGFRCVGRLAFKSCTPTAPSVRGRYTPSARKKAAERPGEEEEKPAAGKPEASGGTRPIRSLTGRDSSPADRKRLLQGRGPGDRTGADRPGGGPSEPAVEPEPVSLPAPPPLEPASEEAAPAEEPAPEEGVIEEPAPEEGVVEEPPAEEGVEEAPVEGAPAEEGTLVPEGEGEGELVPEGF